MEMVLVCTSISLMPPHLTTILIIENETGVIRWDYGDPDFGTCKETIQGGNHFRYWIQDGSSANRYAHRVFSWKALHYFKSAR